MKKSPLYTRTGDNGTTSLVNGTRVKKNSVRLEAYGTVDELNAAVGAVICSEPLAQDDASFLTSVQNMLFDLGSYLATDADLDHDLACRMLPGDMEERIAELERQIDRLDSMVGRLKNFVLPQGARSSVAAHVARTVARRAERRVLDLADVAQVDEKVIRYVNRLSDYLFVLARFNNTLAGLDEIFWQKG